MSARPFADLLRDHRRGATHDELTEKLRELVAAVTEQNKAGTLTITIGMKPAGKASGAFDVSFDAKVKLPKQDPGSSIFFVTPDNNLVREDPRQAVMELREIGPTAAHRGVA